MKVLVIGLPLFASKLVVELQAYDPSNQYIHLDTYYKRADKLKFLYHVKSCDLVYSINGAIVNSKAFEHTIKNKKPLLMHWVGTDVIKAKKNRDKGLVNPDFIKIPRHFCEVEWIASELQEINIEAEQVNFISFDLKNDLALTLPPTFSVLTYIALDREKFYGIDHIIALALKFPDVTINIAGIDQYKDDLPVNINLLGWVDDMTQAVQNATVCLRMPSHDGLSGFVLESLAFGRHVIYRNNYPNCLYAPNQKTLEDHLANLKEKFDSGSLSVNTDGITYIAENFNRDYILSNLVGLFEQSLRNAS